MAREAQCTECRRLVGVVMAPDMGKKPRFKLALHASQVRVASGRGRRPRCLGTGMEIGPEAMWETTVTPDQRKRRELAEVKAAREAGVVTEAEVRLTLPEDVQEALSNPSAPA